jgi:hypothetical protein
MAPRITITDLQQIAAARNGVCLSPEYTNPEAKLKWRCEKGHVWKQLHIILKKADGAESAQ